MWAEEVDKGDDMLEEKETGSIGERKGRDGERTGIGNPQEDEFEASDTATDATVWFPDPRAES